MNPAVYGGGPGGWRCICRDVLSVGAAKLAADSAMQGETQTDRQLLKGGNPDLVIWEVLSLSTLHTVPVLELIVRQAPCGGQGVRECRNRGVSERELAAWSPALFRVHCGPLGAVSGWEALVGGSRLGGGWAQRSALHSRGSGRPWVTLRLGADPDRRPLRDQMSFLDLLRPVTLTPLVVVPPGHFLCAPGSGHVWPVKNASFCWAVGCSPWL